MPTRNQATARLPRFRARRTMAGASRTVREAAPPTRLMQMKPSTLVNLAVAAFVLIRLPAQAPSVQDIAKTAHTLAQQLGALRDDRDKKDELAATKKELAAIVAL